MAFVSESLVHPLVMDAACEAAKRMHVAHYLFGGDADFLEDAGLNILVLGAMDGAFVKALSLEYPRCQIIVVDCMSTNAVMMRHRAGVEHMRNVRVFYMPEYVPQGIATLVPGARYGFIVVNYAIHDVSDPVAFLAKLGEMTTHQPGTRGGLLLRVQSTAMSPFAHLSNVFVDLGVQTIVDARAIIRHMPINHLVNAAVRNGAFPGRPVSDIGALDDNDLAQLLRPRQSYYAYDTAALMHTLHSANLKMAGWAPDKASCRLQEIRNRLTMVDWETIPEETRVRVALDLYGNIHTFNCYVTQGAALRAEPSLQAYPVIVSSDVEGRLWTELFAQAQEPSTLVRMYNGTVASMMLEHHENELMRRLFFYYTQRPRQSWATIREQVSCDRHTPEDADRLTQKAVEYGYLRFTTSTVDILRPPLAQEEITEVNAASQPVLTPRDNAVTTVASDDDNDIDDESDSGASGDSGPYAWV